jgi:hypothetical protein
MLLSVLRQGPLNGLVDVKLLNAVAEQGLVARMSKIKINYTEVKIEDLWGQLRCFYSRAFNVY